MQYDNCHLQWTLSNDGLNFEVIGSTPATDDFMLLPPGVRKQCQILNELLLDEAATSQRDFHWLLPLDSVYEIGSADLATLTLPLPSPIAASVFSKRGSAGQKRLLGLDLRDPEYGVLTGAMRFGGFIAIGGGKFILMSAELRNLDRHLQAEPDVSGYESAAAAQQAYQATAQQLAQMADADVESWLAREEYQFPTSIGVTLDGDVEQGLTVHPNAEGITDDDLQQRLEQSSGRKGVIWKSDGRNRVRMILTSEQREAIKELEIDGKQITPEQIGSFIDNPEAFLPAGIDLAEFSKRVKGLKLPVYNSRPYVHIRKGKLKWFPSVSVELDRDESSETGPEQTDENPVKLDSQEYLGKVKEAMSEGRSTILHNGAIIRFDSETARSLAQVEELAGSGFTGGIPGDSSYILDIFENLNALEFTLEAEVAEEFEEVEPAREILDFQQPEILYAELMPFQTVGYRWLRTLDERRRGGLLADDMGLGKTLQVIGLLAARKEEGESAPSLIVLPKTLIDNWVEEINKFCPSLQIGKYKGGTVSEEDFFSHYDVVLVTYEALRRNQIHLARVDWKVIVCDEAQAIKNPTTGRTTAVKGLKSDMRIAMTGTPVENGLSELWSIMDWVQPGLLKSRQQFRDDFEKPIVEASDDTARSTTVSMLQEKILDHYLRRLKSEVLEGMPEKVIQQERTGLSGYQMQHYQSLIEQARAGGRSSMLACLQKLLKLCACPWDDNQAISITGSSSDIEECPKLGLLFETLDKVMENNEKALIFLERKVVQRMLQSAIFHRYQITPDVINGDVTQGRQALVNRFNQSEGFNVLILSAKVGGTGLNITSANHVIHYMRPWNPAIENQATDRVYRIGQDKPVNVYLPIASWPHAEEKSVEEVLAELIEAKTELAENVIVPTARISLEDEVMKRIFSSENDTKH